MTVSEDAAYLEQSQLLISEPLSRHIQEGTETIFVAVTGSWLSGS